VGSKLTALLFLDLGSEAGVIGFHHAVFAQEALDLAPSVSIFSEYQYRGGFQTRHLHAVLV